MSGFQTVREEVIDVSVEIFPKQAEIRETVEALPLLVAVQSTTGIRDRLTAPRCIRRTYGFRQCVVLHYKMVRGNSKVPSRLYESPARIYFCGDVSNLHAG